MELSIDPYVIEVINSYMNSGNSKARTPEKTTRLERICIDKLRSMAEETVMRNSLKSMLQLKGRPQIEGIYKPKYEIYFQGGSWYQYSWWDGRQKWGLIYFLHGKCERYFEKNSEIIISNFLHDSYGDIETAVLQTDSFMELAEEFQDWIDERRTKFMRQTDADIQKWKEACGASKPQSHGGVANLLKVLTKTMEKQGADIQNIAKVQYVVCVQAGIYIPDEFLRDVAMTLDMKEIEQIEYGGTT